MTARKPIFTTGTGLHSEHSKEHTSLEVPRPILELIEQGKGIRLDIACGANKQEGFLGIDYQALPGVDIVHNIEITPWPIPDNCVQVAVASHIMEHLDPHGGDSRLQPLLDLLVEKGVITQEEVNARCGAPGPVFMRVLDEIWRVMKVGGQLAITTPYATSPGFSQDPTHINQINETTWSYFDPEDKTFGAQLWGFYQAKPWQIQQNYWNNLGNLEVILAKRPDIYAMTEEGLVKNEK